MAEVVLFHHALGLTAGCRAFADDLRAAGHVVHTPDLYDGNVFATIPDGIGYAEGVGFDALFERADIAVADLAERVVYVGISLGVLNAQRLAQTRAGAVAAVLLEACVPVGEFADGWPAGVPVQIHGMDADEFFAGEGDVDNARALVASASETARAELHLYPGDQHLFTDRSLTTHDPDAAALVTKHILDFLHHLDQ